MTDFFLEAQAEARALRHLVDRQDFTRAQHSVERYVKLVEAAVPLMQSGEAASLLVEARDLVDLARRNFRAAQARLSDEMRRVQRVSRYQSGAGPVGSTFHMSL